MKSLTVILYLVVAAVPAAAQAIAPAAARGIPPAVARIAAPGRGSISYGSGTLVDKNDRYGLVVTNWHVINEATGQITVVFPDGFTSGGTVLKVDRDWDLAAIGIWRPNADPVRIADVAPQPGDPLTIAGYGSGQFRAASGKCTQYVAPGLEMPYEMVELAVSARQGDSGGPILNHRGELAGVLFGEGHGRTAGSYCGRVRWFLTSVAPLPGGDLPQTVLAAGGAGARMMAQPVSTGNFAGNTAAMLPQAVPGRPGARVGSLAQRIAPAVSGAPNAQYPPAAQNSSAAQYSSAAPYSSAAQNSSASQWPPADQWPPQTASAAAQPLGQRGNISAPGGEAWRPAATDAANHYASRQVATAARPVADNSVGSPYGNQELTAREPLDATAGDGNAFAAAPTAETERELRRAFQQAESPVPRVDMAPRAPRPTARPRTDTLAGLEGSPAQGAQVHSIGWTDIAGETPGEQLKSVLATIGGLALLIHALGWLSSESSAAAAESAADEDEEEDEEEDDDD